MLRHLLAIALALPIAAHAEGNAEQHRIQECGMKGLVFQMAATWRDSRFSPQYAFDYLHKANYGGLGDALIKNAVNLVYFDERFAGVPGTVMSQVITQECISPSPQWKPIQ